MIAATQELRDGIADRRDFALRYSLLSKDTSLYLVNEREDEEKVRQPVKLQRIPQMQKEFDYSAFSSPLRVAPKLSHIVSQETKDKKKSTIAKSRVQKKKSVPSSVKLDYRSRLSDESLQTIGDI